MGLKKTHEIHTGIERNCMSHTHRGETEWAHRGEWNQWITLMWETEWGNFAERNLMILYTDLERNHDTHTQMRETDEQKLMKETEWVNTNQSIWMSMEERSWMWCTMIHGEKQN